MSSLLAFLAPPAILCAWLAWRYPHLRRVRVGALALYISVVGALVYGALRFVAFVASATVPPVELAVVMWFTVTLRLAWEAWSREIDRLGQGWVRWARGRRRSKRARAMPTEPAAPLLRPDEWGASWLTRFAGLIPPGRAALTAVVFIPLALSFIVTHRIKLGDGQDPLRTLNVPFEQVRIPTSDGLTLDAWFVEAGRTPRPADRTIVICHGAGANKGNFVWFLVPLLHRGYNLVMFDFRAHGGSGGRTCTFGLHERRDVRAVVDWLKRERAGQARVIVGLGSSLGATALALAAADDERIDALVLDSPFVSPRELAKHHAARLPIVGRPFVLLVLWEMGLWTGADFLQDSVERAVAKLGDRPVLVVHGADDALMPAAHAQRLFDAARGPREIWFGPGPHSNIVTTEPDEYGERLFAFLARHLPEDGADASAATQPPRPRSSGE